MTDEEICAALSADTAAFAELPVDSVECSKSDAGYDMVANFPSSFGTNAMLGLSNALTYNPDNVFPSFQSSTFSLDNLSVTVFSDEPGDGTEDLFYGIDVDWTGPLPPPPTMPTPVPTPVPTIAPATPSPTPATIITPSPTIPASCSVGGAVDDIAQEDLETFSPIMVLDPLSVHASESSCSARRRLLESSSDFSGTGNTAPACSWVIYTEYSFTCSAVSPPSETCLVSFLVFPEDVDQDELQGVTNTLENTPELIFTSLEDHIWSIDPFFGPKPTQIRFSSALGAECCPGNPDPPAYCSGKEESSVAEAGKSSSSEEAEKSSSKPSSEASTRPSQDEDSSASSAKAGSPRASDASDDSDSSMGTGSKMDADDVRYRQADNDSSDNAVGVKLGTQGDDGKDTSIAIGNVKVVVAGGTGPRPEEQSSPAAMDLPLPNDAPDEPHQVSPGTTLASLMTEPQEDASGTTLASIATKPSGVKGKTDTTLAGCGR